MSELVSHYFKVHPFKTMKYKTLFTRFTGKVYVFGRKMAKIVYFSTIYDIQRLYFVYMSNFRPPMSESSDIIISLTSYPGRIDNAWLTIESLFWQTYTYNSIVLVLSTQEFKGRELPKSIRQQIRRGLKILWTDQIFKSFGKFIPASQEYHEKYIVTFDDDIIYEKWRLEKLVRMSRKYPNAIIGHRGYVVPINNGVISGCYNTWPRANIKTPSDRCFLTGVGGIIYPLNKELRDKMSNYTIASQLCPAADDIWFWYCAVETCIELICLGINDLNYEKEQLKGPGLWQTNCLENKNDAQLLSLLEVYGESLKLKPYDHFSLND